MNHSDVWMGGLDNFKTVAKETGQNRNVALTGELQISWTVKKSNKTVLQDADPIRPLINRISKD